jgi:hypothetical protein
MEETEQELSKQAWKAAEDFEYAIKQVIIFNQDIRERYGNLLSTFSNSKAVGIFKTADYKIFKYVINLTLDENPFVEILAEDEDLKNKVLELDIYKRFIETMTKYKVAHEQELMYTKLAYRI